MSSTDAVSSDEHELPKGQKKGHGCLIFFVLIFVLPLALTLLLSQCDSSTGGEDSDTLARSACEDHIKKGLKDPASAQFSDISIQGPVGHKWVITGTVRGTNSFGGTAVATFTCNARNDDGTYYTSYKLDE